MTVKCEVNNPIVILFYQKDGNKFKILEEQQMQLQDISNVIFTYEM